MNKTVIAGITILVLMLGMSSNMEYHLAEAKGMPQHLFNPDNHVKGKYLLTTKGNSTEKKYPIMVGYTTF